MSGRGTSGRAESTAQGTRAKRACPSEAGEAAKSKWRGPDSNRRHPGFQPSALPAELPRRGWAAVSVAGHPPPRALASPPVSVEEAAREIAVIGAPLDLGAGRRGVDMGPSAIRYAGLDQQLAEKLGVRVTDAGNVISPVVETTDMGDEHARYLAQILDLCDRLSALVAETAERGALPLVLGGDHSVALGSLVGMAKVRRRGRRRLGRRARRPEHACHLAERQRARDGARRGARAGRRLLQPRRLAAAGGRGGEARARRRSLARRGRAGARTPSSTRRSSR